MDSNNTVAVFIDGTITNIIVFNVGSSKLSLLYRINLPEGKNYNGMTFTYGKFFVSTTAGEIYSVTKENTSTLIYRDTSSANYKYLTSDPTNPGQIFISHDTNTVGEVAVSMLSVTDKRSSDVWMIGFVRNAWGIDVDTEGNIYVCGRTSDNVMQIARDHKSGRELLKASDDIDALTVIDVLGDKFVIFTERIFNVIRVYQLY